ncbi:hypothetical protein AVEN_12878-1 [Araneus ventricosus]|uniref:Uncharacterized protein n=1 Tax=Araneus ventricosus TaxID=182803 RepID=A0A4Y1ZUA2_ARAVE|nr:hypothetical protein AVEN_12878-1 [Araneus ventricosus]
MSLLIIPLANIKSVVELKTLGMSWRMYCLMTVRSEELCVYIKTPEAAHSSFQTKLSALLAQFAMDYYQLTNSCIVCKRFIGENALPCGHLFHATV